METPIHRNSSDFDQISNASLSPVQAQVVTALARGDTVTAAACQAGIHRTTIHHWFETSPNSKPLSNPPSANTAPL